MAKSKFTFQEDVVKFKKLVGAKAAGSQVLIEMLNQHELIDSNVLLGGDDKPSNQGYLLDIGPLVNKDFGLAVGMRVLIQGSTTQLPTFSDSKRVVVACYPDIIKAILNEQ